MLIVEIFATAVSIVGGLFVMSHHVKIRLLGFYTWCISNSLWVIFGLLTGTLGITVTFGFYLISNAIGIYHNRNCTSVTLTPDKLEELTMLVHDAQYYTEYHDKKELEKKIKRILCDGDGNVFV